MAYYHIWTMGCQMNKAESERLGSYLEQQGYQATEAAEEADLIVLNSCVVRHSAENRALSRLNSLKTLKRSRPNLAIAVTGCLVDSEVGELERRFPHVDLFFGPGALPDLMARVGRRGDALPRHPSPSTLVPIIQGCDNFCSYCIVHYRRGRERSRPVEEIVAEVEELVGRGAREVSLVGQNVNSYGHDLPERPDLAQLLTRLNEIAGLWRIRFLTSHPKDVSPEFARAMARLEKVCPHLSLPLQSGDDDILRAMRRGYTGEQYRQLIGRLRQAIPGVAISTDVIVGFPGETEEQFQRTFDLVAEMRCDTVHVAAYSPRPGTLASKELADSVPAAEKKRRRQRIEALEEGIAAEINAGLRGKAVKVLVEGKRRGRWYGRTPTAKLVFFSHGAELRGQLMGVRVDKTGPWWLEGTAFEE